MLIRQYVKQEMKKKYRQSSNVEDVRIPKGFAGPQQMDKMLSPESLSDYKESFGDKLTIPNPGTNVMNHSLPTILQPMPMTDGDTKGMGGMANAGASRKPDSARKFD